MWPVRLEFSPCVTSQVTSHWQRRTFVVAQPSQSPDRFGCCHPSRSPGVDHWQLSQPRRVRLVPSAVEFLSPGGSLESSQSLAGTWDREFVDYGCV